MQGAPIPDQSRVYLLPGDLHATAAPCEITTILGSCVAVCLWDASSRTGGMNHFLLPQSRDGAQPSMRFGDVATQELLHRLHRLGCRHENLTAKLFGGSALWQPDYCYEKSLGALNVEAAHTMMKSYKIRIIAADTGGNQGRKIVFSTDDGSAWARRI